MESEGEHPLPRKHILLLTCMDVRLIDNTVAYMNALNLTNRYDQVVFAGASLGVMRLTSPPAEGRLKPAGTPWKDVFFHHLHLAIEVLDRNVSDVFIIEHRDCGAYQHYHPHHNEPYGDDRPARNSKKLTTANRHSNWLERSAIIARSNKPFRAKRSERRSTAPCASRPSGD